MIRIEKQTINTNTRELYFPVPENSMLLPPRFVTHNNGAYISEQIELSYIVNLLDEGKTILYKYRVINTEYDFDIPFDSIAEAVVITKNRILIREK